MRKNIIDLKLLCAGAGIGALTCSALVGVPAAHVCGTVAIVAVMFALSLRYFEAHQRRRGQRIMSMIRCEACDAIFDSDEDPDCFVEVGNMRRLHQTLILCEHCRDQRDIESRKHPQQQP